MLLHKTWPDINHFYSVVLSIDWKEKTSLSADKTFMKRFRINEEVLFKLFIQLQQVINYHTLKYIKNIMLCTVTYVNLSISIHPNKVDNVCPPVALIKNYNIWKNQVLKLGDRSDASSHLIRRMSFYFEITAGTKRQHQRWLYTDVPYCGHKTALIPL